MAKTTKRSPLANVTRRAKEQKQKKATETRQNAALVHNPPFLQDLANDIAPGLVVYTAARLIGRIAYRMARKSSPRLARHLGAVSPVVAAAAAWIATHKVERLSKYHSGAVIGGSIAAVQSIMQNYLPQWGWFLNDYHLEDLKLPPIEGKQVKDGKSEASAVYALPEKEFVDFDEDELDDLGFGVGQDDASLEALEEELG